ncbi:MAG: hypothetical protein ACTS22_07240 [Phycisphaerales bacterium]
MPPLPRFRIDAIEDLARQLRYAPASALVRDLERTEAFAYEVDPAAGYPLDYVVFRVTGYRPEGTAHALRLIGGEDLLGELATLVEHLSASAKIPLSSLDGALSAEELCGRWSVSRKTLERYRRRGLLSRRVVGPGGKPRVAYMPEAVRAFEAREPETIAAASGFSRLEPEVRQRVLRDALEHARAGMSLNQAALAIAERIGRGHETVRQILQQHEQLEGEPLFDGTGPMRARERRLCYRAWRRAIEPGLIAERVGKPRSSVLRATTDERAEALRAALPSIAAGLRTDPPNEMALTKPGATQGIGLGGPDLLEDLLTLARGLPPMSAGEERDRLTACRELRRRAARAIEALPEHGNSAPAIDQIESDLRWSARIKAELLRGQLPVMLRAIESRLGVEAETLGGQALRGVFVHAIRAAAAAIDLVHPSERGRLASPVTLAVDRTLRGAVRPALGDAASPTRARRKISAAEPVDDFTRLVYPWQDLVEPDPRLPGALVLLAERDRMILRSRFGYAPSEAGRPLTLAELAEQLGSRPLHVARSERAAVRRALEVARRAGTMPP